MLILLTASTIPVHIHTKSTDVRKWTPQEVADYFEKEGFERKDTNQFVEQDIDGQCLMLMHREDLMRMSLKIGTSLKMWNQVQELKTDVSSIYK